MKRFREYQSLYGRFQENGLHERYCSISKSRRDVQYVEVTVHLFCLRDEHGIGRSKFLLESALESLHVNYAPPLLRGGLDLVRDTAAKKELDMAI